MSQPSLHELFSRVQKSSDKWALYLDLYEEWFATIRDRPVSILEIGIQNGGFTSVLAEYFRQAERIVGCDINEKCSELVFSDPRISVVIGDASDVGTYERIKAQSGQFDIVIDDGSHTSKDIVTAFCHYFPLLKDDGLFIAEDLHCSYWIQYEGGLAHQYSSMSFFKLLADVVNYEHWGVPQSRSRLLEQICAHHGCEIPEQELGKVFSVTFVNSMCLVKKKAAKQVMLGERLVTGSDAAVVNNAPFNHTEALRFDQRGNPYSDLGLIGNKHVFGLFEELMAQCGPGMAEVKRELAELKEELMAQCGPGMAEVKRELAELKEELSWLRWIRKFFKAASR